MKEFTVKLGGKDLVLKYTRQERRELEARYKKGLREIILEDVYPLDSKNEPTGGGKLESQIAFLYFGLRHGDFGKKKLTESKVDEWVADAVENHGGHMLIYLTEAFRACMASGVLGYVIQTSEVEEEEGKETPTE